MQKKNLPGWLSDGVLENVESPRFLALKNRLETIVRALQAAAAETVTDTDSATEMLALYGRGLDIVRTLMTLCRAQRSLNTSDTTAPATASRISALEQELNRAAKNLLRYLATFDVNDPVWKSEPFASWRVFVQEKRNDFLSDYSDEEKKLVGAMQSLVLVPLTHLHSHLTSNCRVEVLTQDSHRRTQSFSQCVATLKGADDVTLRRSTFDSMNAWFAVNAPAFADLLNAITGFRETVISRRTPNFYEHVFCKHRLSAETFNSMFQAIDSRLDDIRESVRCRARFFGESRMRAYNLLSPGPGPRWQVSKSFDESLADLRAAMGPLNAHFSHFIDETIQNNWIEARNIPMKSGGGWCDNLPAMKEVRVFTSYVPSLAGAMQVAHLLGVAYQHRVLHEASSPERIFPLTMTEIAGSFHEVALIQHLRRTSLDEATSAIVLWQELKMIANSLLVLPARHVFSRNMMRERCKGSLTVSKLNELVRESWEQYFGDTVVGCDQYLWAHKPHFYKVSPIFYDFQYTFGFLVAQKLLKVIRETGKTASGATLDQFWRESGSTTCEALLLRHLGEDPREIAFWEEAIDLALEPVHSAVVADLQVLQ